MINNQETYELIDRYLNKELTTQERMLFEKRLANEPSLSSEVHKIQQVNEWIVLAGMSQDKAEINKAEKRYIQQQNYFTFGKRLASGLLMVVTASSLAYVLTKTIESPKHQTSITLYPVEQSVGNSTSTQNKTEKEVRTITTTPVAKPNNRVIVNTSKDTVTIIPEKLITTNQTEIPKHHNTIPPAENKKNPCENPLTVFFSTTPTCQLKNEGSISLAKTENGKEPFELSINNNSFKPTTTVRFLNEGEYNLIVRDGNGCISAVQKITVESKTCTIHKDVIFSYSSGQEWDFPTLETNDFRFVLFNAAGEKLKTIDVQNNFPSSWNGLDKNENKLRLGTYPYKIISNTDSILYDGMFTIID